MRKILLVGLLLLTCVVYFIPLVIIVILATMCHMTGIHEDLTSTKLVTWFVKPIVFLEHKAIRGK